MCDYDMMTNEELVVLVGRKDSRALEMLEHRFSKFILFKARKLQTIDGLEREDILQEARLCLYRACLSFDPERGCRFMTYFATLLENHYGRMLRRAAQRKDPLSGCAEFDDEIGLSEGSLAAVSETDEPEEEAMKTERHEALMESIRNDLTPSERDAVLSYLTGKDYRSIARSLGTNEKAVDNALMRAKRKLRLSMAAYR